LLPAALGLKNGDAKIIKNAGGLVISAFDSAMRSLIVAIYELGVEEIMVVAHLQRYTWEQGERYGQTGSETACNRERYGILPDSGGRSHELGRAPLYIGAPALICWSGRSNPSFIL
jgi:hypothetical protein